MADHANVPGEGPADGLPGDCGPQPHRLISAAAGQPLTVRAVHHNPHRVGVPDQGLADGPAADRVPQPHRSRKISLTSSGRWSINHCRNAVASLL